MNIVEFFNKSYSLKGEVILEIKKFCLTIVKIDEATKKATDTKQFYLSFSEGQVLFSDILSEKFWTSDTRYPNGQFRRTKTGDKGYRDLLITRDGLFSIINGEKNQVLRFKLDTFEMVEMAYAMFNYLDKMQLAWAIAETNKPKNPPK